MLKYLHRPIRIPFKSGIPKIDRSHKIIKRITTTLSIFLSGSGIGIYAFINHSNNPTTIRTTMTWSIDIFDLLFIITILSETPPTSTQQWQESKG
jgi:hypothetical protein